MWLSTILMSTVLAACGGGEQGRDPILGLPAAELTSLAVTPANNTLEVGATQQLIATATYADGSSRDVTASASWTSAKVAVATVGASTGMASAASAGSTVITAALGGKSGTANLTVPTAAATLSSIAVTPANGIAAIGTSLPYIATGTYADGSTKDITGISTWTSGTTSVASITATGVTNALSAGVTVIKATAGSKSGTANLNVTAATAALSSITVTPANGTAAVGATLAYTATGNFADGTSMDITGTSIWTSATIGVGTITSNGLANALSAGVTIITATSGTKTGTAKLTVTAPLPVGGNVNLRSAANFGVLAGTSITNNAGGLTLVTGDVGAPSQTVDPVQAAGFANYKSGAILANALADLQVAITDAKSRTCDVNSAAGVDLGGLVFTPGVYCYAGAISITGTFTMNGPGVYIFRTTSTLNTTANSIVALTGGADAESVFWVPTAPTTLGATSVFKGSILGQSAAITLGDGANLQNGRVLTGAAATLRNNVITR
jgi:hypothetical protein